MSDCDPVRPVIDACPPDDRVSHIDVLAALLRRRYVRRTGCHRPHRLKHFLRRLPVAGLCLGLSVGSGLGGDTRVGIEITSDRDPDDFAIPSATKYKFRASHSFDSGVSLGASLEVTDTAFSPSHSENLEATAGYRYRLTDAFSLVGSAGAGERFRAASDGGNFPYYLATVAGDVRITETMTWNAISYRYRNAFDLANDYETPQIATGLTLRLNPHNWLTIKLSRTWKGGSPSSTGIAIGYPPAAGARAGRADHSFIGWRCKGSERRPSRVRV